MSKRKRTRVNTVKLSPTESIIRPSITGYERGLEESYQNLLREYREAEDAASKYDFSDSSQEAQDALNRKYELMRDLSDRTRYRYAGTQWDPMKYALAYPVLKTGKFVESEDGADAAEFFRSYADSPGFSRIVDNQREWYSGRNPGKEYDESAAASYANLLRGLTGEGIFDTALEETESFSGSAHNYGPVFLGTTPQSVLSRAKRGELPRAFLLGHELTHTAPWYSGVNGKVLDTNRGAEWNLHDELRSEKQADIQGLKYLMYKEGIYDARGDTDATVDDVKELRAKYPELRPFQQMSDEQIADMLNLVADSGEGDGVHDVVVGNMSDRGGRIKRIIDILNSRSDRVELLRKFKCGGKKYGPGGKFFRTSVPESDDSMLYQAPERTGYYDIEPPARWIPEPYLGDYEYPKYNPGVLQSYPIPMGYPAVQPGHGVLIPEDQPVSTVAAIDPIKDAARRIMAVENSKANANGGWDAKTGRWYPHKSVEGGADTIAYGIKLSNGTPEAALALKQGYLTDEQAASAVDTLARKYYDAAKRVYDKKYGEGEWDKLSDKSQSILVDYSYNPGLAKFPSLMEGFHSGNMDLIRKNYKRYVNGKELGRNKVLLEEIDTLGNQYSIFRAKGGKIHIKPENRGKFTALLKRTGKSASWFKEHGTPLQRKRATFALNARKWRHGDGGFLRNYFDEGGPYGDASMLYQYQEVPEFYGGTIAPSVAIAQLPSKFNGSQEAARRYAEGYLKGAKPVSEAMDMAGRKIFNTVDTVVGLTPTPAGAISWLGHMVSDVANGEYGRVGKDLTMAAVMGLGLRALGRGYGYLKNYWDDIGNFGEDTFRAFTDVPTDHVGNVSEAFRYENIPSAVGRAVENGYQIQRYPGYMPKSLMEGSPLEKQMGKNGTVSVNNIRALMKNASRGDQAAVERVLASEDFAGKKTVDYNAFRKAVQNELITYERAPDTRYEVYGLDDIGYSPTLTEPIQYVRKAKTNLEKYDAINDYGTEAEKDMVQKLMVDIREGKISDREYKTKFDDLYVKFTERIMKDGPVNPETFTFSSPRIPKGSKKHYDANTLGHSRTFTTKEEPGVRYVLESQADWGQARYYDAEGNAYNASSFKEKFGDDPALLKEARAREKDFLTPEEIYLKDTYPERQIIENLRIAAENGERTMRYATRETAAKIEKYNKFRNEDGTYPQKYETILKRYDDFVKQYRKLYKDAEIRTVKDSKGNTWYEVDVPEDFLQREWRYSKGGILGRATEVYGGNINKIRQAIQNAKLRQK
jgi:hypothetical protein